MWPVILLLSLIISMRGIEPIVNRIILRGHPCLTPLLMGIFSVSEPFIII